jgi:proteic killer suppression protein
MITGFADAETALIWSGRFSRKLPQSIQKTALRRLQQLHAAASLDDLRALPGNRLEALRGNRRGQHSIRINDQWRVRFRWTDRGAADVAIIDYH